MIIPGTDPMFHRHLVAAYAAVWIIQVGYAAYVARKWFLARRAQRATEASGQQSGTSSQRYSSDKLPPSH